MQIKNSTQIELVIRYRSTGLYMYNYTHDYVQSQNSVHVKDTVHSYRRYIVQELTTFS
jgi:hypothetical protein